MKIWQHLSEVWILGLCLRSVQTRFIFNHQSQLQIKFRKSGFEEASLRFHLSFAKAETSASRNRIQMFIFHKGKNVLILKLLLVKIFLFDMQRPDQTSFWFRPLYAHALSIAQTDRKTQEQKMENENNEKEERMKKEKRIPYIPSRTKYFD